MIVKLFIVFLILFTFVNIFSSFSFFHLQSRAWKFVLIMQVSFVLLVVMYEYWVWRTVDLTVVPIRCDILVLRPIAIFVTLNVFFRLCSFCLSNWLATTKNYRILQCSFNILSFLMYFVYCYIIMGYNPFDILCLFAYAVITYYAR